MSQNNTERGANPMTAPPAGALEACPFCGGEAELRGKTQQRYVACLTARCVDGPYGDFDDDAAIAAWNRRTHGPALLAALRLRERAERLEAALRYVVNQNEHDMVLTGEEIRGARAALADDESASR